MSSFDGHERRGELAPNEGGVPFDRRLSRQEWEQRRQHQSGGLAEDNPAPGPRPEHRADRDRRSLLPPSYQPRTDSVTSTVEQPNPSPKLRTEAAPFRERPIEDRPIARGGDDRRFGPVARFLFGFVLFIPIGILLYLFVSQRVSQTETAESDEISAPSTTEPIQSLTQTEPEAVESEAADPQVDESEAETSGGTEEAENGDTSEQTDDESGVVPPTSPAVRAVLAGDQVTLEGEVPSEAAAESLVELLAPVAGEGNVDSQMVINPDVGPIEGMSITVADEVLFNPGSDEISPQFFPTLDRIVTLLQLNPNISVVVKGHTDAEGDEVQNLALSQRRADAVVVYIAENSINRFRLEPRGRGSGEPVDDNSTSAGRSRNRRIEFEVSGFSLALDT